MEPAKAVLFVGGAPRATAPELARCSWERLVAADEAEAERMLAEHEGKSCPIRVVVVADPCAKFANALHQRAIRPACVIADPRRDTPRSSDSSVQLSVDAVELAQALERADRLQARIHTPSVRGIVDNARNFGAAPKTYFELVRAASERGATAAVLGKIIERDSLLTLRLLQLVNSAHFGISRRVTSIADAIGIVGLDALKGLALTAQVFSFLADEDVLINVEQVQEFSVRVARLARQFARDAERDDVFTAALVLDVGRLLIAASVTKQQMQDVTERILETAEPLHVAERAVLGAAHPEVGAHLLSVWGIPFPIVECVAYHHEPRAAAGDPVEQGVLAVGHAADALLGITLCGEPAHVLDVEFLMSAGRGDQLPAWRSAMAAHAPS